MRSQSTYTNVQQVFAQFHIQSAQVHGLFAQVHSESVSMRAQLVCVTHMHREKSPAAEAGLRASTPGSRCALLFCLTIKPGSVSKTCSPRLSQFKDVVRQ